MEQKNSSPAFAILIITLCGCFLFYKYVLQIYPSVITDQLMREFHLTGEGLGNLAASFYYAFMISQLMVGYLLDRFSARWITACAIFSCALGAYLFAHSTSLLAAGLSRALMGVGVAFATVAYMKLASVWFAPKRYAFVCGLVATAAMGGAVFGEAPLSALIDHFGWRPCISAVGIVGFSLSLLFLLLVRDAPTQQTNQTKSKIFLKDILQVLQSKQNWLLTLYSGLAFSPIAVFGGLWGNPFLQQAYHLDKTQSASLVSLVFVGLGIGSPLLGMLSSRFKQRRYLMMIGTLVSCLAISMVLYGHPFPTFFLALLLFIFGFGLGAFVLAFTIGKEINKIALTATVVAMINASDAVLDAITEPAMGKLLDVEWTGKIVNGVHYFSLHSYHLAMSVLPMYLILASVLLLWVKDRPLNVMD